MLESTAMIVSGRFSQKLPRVHLTLQILRQLVLQVYLARSLISLAHSISKPFDFEGLRSYRFTGPAR
jgi:hypothetical protein